MGSPPHPAHDCRHTEKSEVSVKIMTLNLKFLEKKISIFFTVVLMLLCAFIDEETFKLGISRH